MVADAGRRGYTLLLDSFRDQARTHGLAAPAAVAGTAPAWCNARRKLDPEFVRRLIHRSADAYDQRFGSEACWHGRRAFGIDGSKFNLRRSAALDREFGTPHEAHCPQALISTLFNLCSYVPHDVVVAPYATNEREEMVRLLDRVRPDDVLVFDRGYPSYEVLRMLQDAGIDFVVRIPTTKTFPAIQPFLRGPVDDTLVILAPPPGHPMHDDGAMTVRALRSTIPGKGPLVVLTSLPAPEFPATAIIDLYRRRWEIEEYYKVVKSDYFDQRQFHGKSAAGIRQEIYAVGLYVSISRYLMAAAAEAHALKAADMSPKAGILGVSEYLVRLLLTGSSAQMFALLADLAGRICRVKEPKRPGRKCPRRSLKPSPKWGPLGRRGG